MTNAPSNSHSRPPPADSRDHSPADAKKRPERVMVPFFEGAAAPATPSRGGRGQHSRRHRNRSEVNLPRNRSFHAKRETIHQPPSTKEVGLNPEPPKSKLDGRYRNSYPSFKPKQNRTFPDFQPPEPGKFEYIDSSNVGNIRPLNELYNKPAPREAEPDPGVDQLAEVGESHLADFSYQLDEPREPHQSFVDALIRNSNTFDDVTPGSPPSESTKSQQLKSVLTKMGILDRSEPPNPKDEETLKELEKTMDKHYVFPKYMSSPDPSSLPIPGSL